MSTVTEQKVYEKWIQNRQKKCCYINYQNDAGIDKVFTVYYSNEENIRINGQELTFKLQTLQNSDLILCYRLCYRVKDGIIINEKLKHIEELVDNVDVDYIIEWFKNKDKVCPGLYKLSEPERGEKALKILASVLKSSSRMSLTKKIVIGFGIAGVLALLGLVLFIQ